MLLSESEMSDRLMCCVYECVFACVCVLCHSCCVCATRIMCVYVYETMLYGECVIVLSYIVTCTSSN